jgi:hypothetical protein
MLKKEGKGSLVVLLLAERAASEGPRWTRAVEDQSAPIPEEATRELGRIIYIVRRAQSRIDQATL